MTSWNVFNSKYSNTTPSLTPELLLTHLQTLHNSLNATWNTSPTNTTTTLITSTAILLRISASLKNNPFHNETSIKNILQSISTSTPTKHSTHTIALVKLLYNILLTWKLAARTIADNNGGQILSLLIQSPLSATDARLICILVERLIATCPSFPGNLFLPHVINMLKHVLHATIPKQFPHGNGRLELNKNLFNLLYAITGRKEDQEDQKDNTDNTDSTDSADSTNSTNSTETERKDSYSNDILNLIYDLLQYSDNLENTIFNVQCASINLLLYSKQRDQLKKICDTSGMRSSTSVIKGISIYSKVVNICEKWLIIYMIEKKNTNKIDATLLPLLLVLINGMNDSCHVVKQILIQRLQKCEYLKICVQQSMSTFGSSSRVSVAMGDLVMLMCDNRPDLLMKYVGQGPAIGVLQRQGLLNIPNSDGVVVM